jgi:hypothetical protein
MNQNKIDPIEEILKTYSLVSGREEEILWSAVLKTTPGDSLLDPGKANRFLERFPVEKPFGDMLLEAVAGKQTSIDRLSEEISLSKSSLEKVLSHAELPNIIPIKKMKALLHVLQIPITRAVESMKASMERFNMKGPFAPFSGVVMGRSRRKYFSVPNANRSKESLKRGLKAYINRLLEEER